MSTDEPAGAAMRGLTRKRIDRTESRDFAIGDGPLRPRDAGTLILLDRRNGVPFVLIGRRRRGHAFMPGKFVFPGGRTDPSDGRIRTGDALDARELEKLTSGPGRKASAIRARAIALSAVRETYEEAGYLIGARGAFDTPHKDWQGFVEHGVAPALSRLRFVARAITPPGRVRRFDTRFFATFVGSVAVTLKDGGPTDELEELAWLPMREAMEADVPVITRTVLDELGRRLAIDPELSPGGDVPFYHMKHNRFRRDII